MKTMKSLVTAGLILGVLAGTCEAQPAPYNPSESLDRKIERDNTYRQGIEDGQRGHPGVAPYYNPSESLDRKIERERDYQQGVEQGLNQRRQKQSRDELLNPSRDDILSDEGGTPQKRRQKFLKKLP